MLSDRRYTAIFGAALLTASGATFTVYRLIGTANKPQREPVRTVVVAVRDVPVGVPVPRQALGVVSWPARVAPAESFATADSIVGRITREPLMPGEPVLAGRLAVRGAAPGLEGAIDPARRAMAVRVNEAASVSGLVRANSRVDVLVATHADGTQAARVIMTDVRVLGVGSVRPPETPSGTSESAPPPNATASAVVTLEVTPTQAADLAAAEQQGAVQVVLRGYGSTGDGRLAESAAPTPASSAALAASSKRAGPAPTTLGTSAPTTSSGPSYARIMEERWADPMGGGPRRSLASIMAEGARRPDHGGAPPPSAAASPRQAGGAERTARSGPESTTVYLYRGGALTTLRMGVTGPAPSPAPTASAADEARDAAVRPVRTADARRGGLTP